MREILSVIYILLCAALIALVSMQAEGTGERILPAHVRGLKTTESKRRKLTAILAGIVGALSLILLVA